MRKSGFWKIFILIAACNPVFAATADKKPDQADIADPADGFTDTTPKAQPPQRAETKQGQQLQRQLENTDIQTNASWLGVKPDHFLALYRADSSGKPYANLILLHDNQQHPDWPGLVHQIRTQLTRHGWNTLSAAVPMIPVGEVLAAPELQNPAPPASDEAAATPPPGTKPAESRPEPDTAEATAAPNTPVPDAATTAGPVEYPAADVPSILAQRVQHAVRFIRAQSPLPIFIAAIGSSATQLEQQGQVVLSEGISAVVIIDPTPLPDKDGLDPAAPGIQSLALPVLDLVPEFNPHSDPQLRKQEAAQLQRRHYQQRVIPGATAGFVQYEMAVIKAIRGWGKRLLAGD
ncbi:DUF3530 family protein [Ketobacter sp. MCCC 1A13808]|uniref:DUF3530 family protein n=1 Tax=Ketobacter sp. MCCC 1A13808 TaxID=2602738 RepID=UPI0012EBE4EF|nr:DUF3530 family protein [Ketobacter sp. MCCC 1A13808]MVF13090.1 DUF3530 family protein [Ketobacter sp. MCCC 1A13808]